jgi:glycopeptide antibiotics resistance protein
MTNPRRARAAGQRLTAVLLSVYLALLVAVVLFKLPFYSGSLIGQRAVSLIPFQGSLDAGGNIGWHEIAYNVALFVPLGVYTSMMTNWTVARRTILTAGISILFEAIQYVFSMGVTDVTDVLGNTLGGAIGIGVHAALQRSLASRTAKTENLIALILTALALTRFLHLFYLSHFVMQPAP